MLQSTAGEVIARERLAKREIKGET